ncbi:MAG: PfkB family carbohydrate kinase [Novosphingobium sp.]
MTGRPINRQAKLITVGDNCLDVYVNADVMAVGGNALNVAAQWARHGWSARYFGAVGKDAEGDALLEAIARTGLAATDIERLPGDTAVTLIREHAGERHFLLEDLGVGEGYFPSADRYDALKTADWVHLGTHSNLELLRKLVEDGIPFSIDVSTKPRSLPLGGVPLVFASGPEAHDASIESEIQALLDHGARKAVVTCGSRGAYFHDGASLYHMPAEQIEAVDTCGAGDSFIATFITAYCIEKAEPPEAMRRATGAASETCLHKGGFPQDLRQIPAWLSAKYADIIRTQEIC